jgi:hypothetical protein
LGVETAGTKRQDEELKNEARQSENSNCLEYARNDVWRWGKVTGATYLYKALQYIAGSWMQRRDDRP